MDKILFFDIDGTLGQAWCYYRVKFKSTAFIERKRV